MKRRFRPTFGGLVLESKANANNATTASSDAATTQQTRRARFKPKVGLVAGKTSNQTKASPEVPTNPNQLSASTIVPTSPVNKSGGRPPSTSTTTGTLTGGSQLLAGTNNNTVTTAAKNQPSDGTRSVALQQHKDAASQLLTGMKKATVTTTAGSKPISHQSVQSRRRSSPVKKNVGGQPSTTISPKDPGSDILVGSTGGSLVNDGSGSLSLTGTNHSTLPVNIDNSQPSAGTNKDTMVERNDNPPSTDQHSTRTGIGASSVNKSGNSLLSASTNKDTLTRSVGEQPLHGQQPIGNRRHSSTLSKGTDSEAGADKDKITTNVGDQSSFGGKTPSLPVNTLADKDNGGQSTDGTTTDNSAAVNKDTGSQPSVGTDNSSATNENAGNETSKLETAKNTDEQISTGTNKDTITTTADPSSSVTNNPRASSQNKVTPNVFVPDQPRRARIKPKVGLASAKAPVQKTVSSKKPTPSSVTISSDETGVSQASVSTAKEAQNVTTSTLSATTKTACQPLTDPVGASKTSTRNATASPETNVQNEEPTTSERSVPTRRSRIIPNVGKVNGKISKTPVKKTNPVCQGTISVEAPSVDAPVPPEGASKRASTTLEDLNETALLYEKDTANVVNQPLTVSIVGEPNTEQKANTSEKNANSVNPSLTSTNITTQNENSPGPEKSKTASTSAPTQPARRARFKPRVGITGSRSPAVPTRRTQTKPSAVNKPPLSSTSSKNVAENDTDSTQNLGQGPGKSVSEENRSAQAITASPSRNTDKEQTQSRAIVERSDENSTSNVTPTFVGENVTVAVSLNINESAQERVEHETMVLSANVSEYNQSTNTRIAEQTTSLACVELSDERQQTVGTQCIHSNTKPTELIEVSDDITSQKNVSPESGALQDSLQDAVILPQHNELVCEEKDSASTRTASCLPVMMEDSSILHPRNTVGDGLSQIFTGLRDEGTPDLSTAFITDSDLSQFHQLESADDTRITTPDIQSNPCESIHTPSSSTRLENETRISTQSSEPLDEARTVSPSNEVDCTLNQSTQPAQNKQATTTSRLVTKRQRRRPRSKQRPQPLEASVLDISTIPIASNIEIEPEVNSNDDINHPVLELPVDLIQENLAQNSPKAGISSGGLKQRFKQRRSGTVKLVLSRQRSESSDMEKMNESVSTSGDRGSTVRDRSSTAVDSGSTSMDRSRTSMDRSDISGDSSTSQNTTGQGVAERSREITRKARIGPNILVRRKTNKRNDPKKPTSESRIFGGKNLEAESQDNQKCGAISVDALSSSSQEVTLSSEKGLSSGVQDGMVTRKRSSVTDESVIDLSNEIQLEVEVTNNESVIVDSSEQDLSNGPQSEIVLSEDVSKRSSSVPGSGNNTSENAENCVQSHRIITDTRVKDLSKDCEVEICLEVTNPHRDNSNIVYESGDVSDSDSCCVIEKQSGDAVASLANGLETESALESSDYVHGNVNTICDAVHSQLSNVSANLSDNNEVHELTQYSNKVVARKDRTDDGKTQTSIPDIQSSTSLQSFSLASPETTIEENPHTTLQAQDVSNSTPDNNSTANSGPKSVRPNSSALLDISPNPPDSTTLRSVCNDGQTKRIAKFSTTTDNSEAECILAGPKSSTPLHDVSLNIQESTIEQCLSSEVETNEHSRSGAEDISTGKNTIDPISTSQIEDVSLNIPESAIEEAIRNTTEPLPDVIECPECPELVLCLTTVDDASINEHAQNAFHTQPGTLEDSVARATRRASGEFEEPAPGSDVGREQSKATSGNEANSETSTATNEKAVDSEELEEISKSKKKDNVTIQRKRKARRKIVDDDDEADDINGSNMGSGTQADDGNIRTHDTSGNDDLGVQDGPLGDTCVQDGTTQGSCGGSTLDEPNDPTQDTSSKPGSRKRQAKAPKPNIAAKRSRKKIAVAQETENVEPCNENEQDTTDAPEGGTSSRNASQALPESGETPPTSQKRKRGRPRGSKKSTAEKNKQPETASVEETPSKKRKGQRSKASEKLDAVVNIANMRICDMITYNPTTNPMSSTNDEERQTSFLSGISQSETILPENEDQPVEDVGGGERTAVCAPRVTIDADGNIVLDEESLVIESTPAPDTLDKEVVFENANQQYKATHKRKNMDRWGKEETLYFYEVLSQTGTDFSLMAKLFRKRNRSELKRKFKREEKVNRDLIDKALSQRIPLAASLFADCLEETEEEMERSLVVQTAANETTAQA